MGQCVKKLLKCYAESAPSKQNPAKVEMRTFIAHANAANTGLGLAVRDGHLDCSGPGFRTVRRFLQIIQSVQ